MAVGHGNAMLTTMPTTMKMGTTMDGWMDARLWCFDYKYYKFNVSLMPNHLSRYKVIKFKNVLVLVLVLVLQLVYCVMFYGASYNEEQTWFRSCSFMQLTNKKKI